MNKLPTWITKGTDLRNLNFVEKGKEKGYNYEDLKIDICNFLSRMAKEELK